MTTKDRALDIATAILNFRRIRTRMLPAELFSEPSWDLLLEIYIADAAGARIDGRGVCGRSAIPPPVMSRWLMHLNEIGLIIGGRDGNLDGKLSLSAGGRARMKDLLRAAGLMQVG